MFDIMIRKNGTPVLVETVTSSHKRPMAVLCDWFQANNTPYGDRQAYLCFTNRRG